MLSIQKVKEELEQMIREGKEIEPAKWETGKKDYNCKKKQCPMVTIFEGKAYSRFPDLEPGKGVYGNYVFLICRKCGRSIVRLDS